MINKNNFLDRIIERLDRLDPSSVQGYVLRLVRERGFLETVFNTIREGVMVIDHELGIHYCNPASQSLLGLPDDFSELRLDRFLRDVDWKRLMSADPAEWYRISMQEIEVYYPIHRYLKFYLVPYKSEHERDLFPMAIIILHDVTDVHKDTAETIESQKVKAITMLAAGVAHEIGNPLNSLNIHLQLLGRRLAQTTDKVLAAEAKEFMDVATQEIERLDTIINNFLRAVRPVSPEMTRLRISQVLSEALGFMRREIEDRNILVEASWAENLPMIMGDADQLKQAFFNLIKNAVQAMPDGGLLRIGCKNGDEMLEISFADNGKGIPQEKLGRILEPYYTTRSDGTGLGLLIVDRIVRSHGGELGIDTVEGQGTVFTIRLPLQERKVRLLKAPGTPQKPGPGTFDN